MNKMFQLKIQSRVLSLLIIVLLSLLFSSTSYSQKQTTIDSLSRLLGETIDSSRVVILRQLSWEYRNLDTSKAIAYGNEAITIAKKLKLNHEQADILGRLGIYKRNQGNFSKAMDYYFKGLEIAQKYNFRELQALEFNNIGDIYYRLDINDQALDYVFKAMSLSTQLKDNYNLSYIHHMLGLIYMNMSLPDSSLTHFRTSLILRKQLNLQTSIASSYLNIGIAHFMKTNYDSSFVYYNKALVIFIRMNDKVGCANCYKCLGEYFNQKAEYGKALMDFEKSMKLIKGYGIPQVKKDAAEGLKYCYLKLGDYKKALYYHEFATRIKDSISSNIYIQKITRLTENYKFDIQNRQQEILQKQKEEILNQRISIKKNQLNFFIIAFLLMVILIGIIIFFYRIKNKAFDALNQKNNEIAELNKGLIKANEEIISQKIEIESQRDVLQVQSEELTQLVRTKDKLFSIIAHDLRGPFSTIIGFSEYVKENIRNSKIEDIEEMNNHINQIGVNTLKVLENLLDWAKAQVHQVTINLENINISVIINETIKGLAPQANSKSLRLLYQDPKDILVKVDLNMVSTVLRNLVSNSIKYSNPGSEIIISVRQDSSFAEVSVKDFGIGMSQDLKNSLFVANINPSTYGTANEKGTGLGIAICNEFIKKLNGTIWIESEIGKGSTIRFTLPLGQV